MPTLADFLRPVAVALLAGTASLSAQTVSPGLIDRAQSRPDAPPLVEPEEEPPDMPVDMGGYALPTPGDNDLGEQYLLKRNEKPQFFYGLVNVSAFWTDNAARLPVAEEEDAYFSALIGVGTQVPVGNGFFLNGSLSQEWFRYDEFTALDFESTEASLGGLKVMPALWNSVIGLRYVYRRYTDGTLFDDTYSRHGIALTAQKTFVLNRKNSFYTALTGDWELATDPSILRRHEYNLQAGYDYRLTRRLTLTGFYRLAFRDYLNGDFDEWNNTVGLVAALELASWAGLEASFVYTDNDSNADALDYSASNLGGGLSLHVRF